MAHTVRFIKFLAISSEGMLRIQKGDWKKNNNIYNLFVTGFMASYASIQEVNKERFLSATSM